MTVRPPIVGAALWNTVMRNAEHRCECRGACGKKHADRTRKPGRCELYNGLHIKGSGEVILIATPRDPVNEGDFATAARLPARRLIALCPTCYGRVRARFEKAAKRLEPQADSLFDAEPYYVAPVSGEQADVGAA